jgi:hypothetical protein
METNIYILLSDERGILKVDGRLDLFSELLVKIKRGLEPTSHQSGQEEMREPERRGLLAKESRGKKHVA